MYELVQVSERCYYFESPSKIGLVHLGGENVCLIDSGSDKSAARAVCKTLRANGWKLSAIYNTHSHADHIGGNHYLQAQTGCRVYVPGIECGFTRHPLLEPTFLYGAFPAHELSNKFLQAQPSDAQALQPEALPPGISAIPLPGHSFDMVGYRAADGVVFLADSLASRETLEKYHIIYLWDVESHIHTLEMLCELQAEVFIPSHAEVVTDIVPLARFNKEHIYTVASGIVDICQTPATAEEILQRVCNSYGITLNFTQYVLLGSTLRSYLTWLRNTGHLRAEFNDNRLLWISEANAIR